MRTLPLLLASVFVLVPQKTAHSKDKTKPSFQLAKEKKAEAARKTFELHWKDRLDVETIYSWSRRWLEAVRESGEQGSDRKAVEAHLDRMKKMEQLVQKHLASGGTSFVQLSAAEYYRLEAEIWFEQAKSK